MDSLLNWVLQFGYLGILLASFLENFFPPIPSEVIIPFGGFLVSQGRLSFPLVVLFGVMGTLLGAFFWYGVGFWLGGEKVKSFLVQKGRYLGISAKDLEKTEVWFARHGEIIVFLGRMVPIIRTLVSIPAGFARMGFLRFTLFSFLGILIWHSFLTFLGYLLGESWSLVSSYFKPLELITMASLGFLFLLFFLKRLRKT